MEIEDISDNELKEIFNSEKYDKEIIDFIEIFGACVVSQLFNPIYNQSLVIHTKDEQQGKKTSLFSIYETQLLLYVDFLKTPAGVNKELKKLHDYYNQKTRKVDSFDAYCHKFALTFAPKQANLNAATNMSVATNAVRSILTSFISEVILGMISLIISKRKDPNSPRQLQDKFKEISLLHKFVEHKKWLKKGTATKSGINNEVINRMAAMLEKMRAELKQLETENNKLKKLLVKQDSIMKKQQETIASLSNSIRQTTLVASKDPPRPAPPQEPPKPYIPPQREPPKELPKEAPKQAIPFEIPQPPGLDKPIEVEPMIEEEDPFDVLPDESPSLEELPIPENDEFKIEFL